MKMFFIHKLERKLITTLLVIFVGFLFSCELNEVIPPSEVNTFIKYYGNEIIQEGYSVLESKDRSLVLVGLSLGSLTTHQGGVNLVKVDANGNELNSIIIGSNCSNPTLALNRDSSGYVVLYESNVLSSSSPQSEIVFHRLDENLQPIDTVIVLRDTIGYQYTYTPNHILSTSDGGFLISGTTTNPTSGTLIPNNTVNGNQLFFLKIDAFGNKTWQIFTGATGFDEAIKSIEITNGYVVVYNLQSAGVKIGFLNKLNPTTDVGNGEIFVNKSYRVIDFVERDGVYYLLYSNGMTGTNSKIGIAKYSFNGGSWESKESTELDFEGVIGHAISVFNKSEFLISGATLKNSFGLLDYHLIKVDNSFSLAWDKHFGSSDNDEARDILVTEDNGIVLFGSMQMDKIKMMGLIKVDSEGNFKNQ